MKSSPMSILFAVGALVFILGGVDVQAAKKAPRINLRAIKESASKVSQITTSSKELRINERKITEIVIPSIVVPLGKNPSQLITTSVERRMKTEMEYIVKIEADLENDVADIKEYIIKPMRILLVQMTDYHKQIKSYNKYTKEKIARQISMLSTDSDDYEIPAFYVYRNTPYNKPQSVIPFEEGSLNNECSFNASSGVFTAPMKGIYYFYFQAVKTTGNPQHLNVRLLHNGQEITAQHVASGNVPGDSSIHLPLNIQSILLMEEGDTVSLFLKAGIMDDRLITQKQPWIHRFTSFTGFLLQAL